MNATTKPTAAPDPAPQAVAAPDAAPDKASAAVPAGQCVVEDDGPHVGRATPGSKVCSRHAVHYRADGSRR